MKRKRIIRWLVWGTAGVLALVLIAVGVVALMLRASLPMLDGEVRAAGLRASVAIERDDQGVPTITASNRLDMVYGLGFVHAQDRFFQMDLGRRSAAGELAALIGPAAVEQDVSRRVHRLHRTALQAQAALAPGRRALVEAYRAGVNAGLASLGARPPEYWALRQEPLPWRSEDVLLVLLSMATRLHPPPFDLEDTLLRGEFGAEAFDFFYPPGTDWDAALDGSKFPPAPIPGPEVLDFRRGWDGREDPETGRWRELVWVEERVPEPWEAEAWPGRDPSGVTPGSNAWAVDGSMTATRAALLASDMHLSYTMPGPFYRVRLQWMEEGREHDVIAVTLPGTPAPVAGSNGQVAWAPTAADLDLVDQIALETDPVHPTRYRVPEGWAEFETIVERIAVRGRRSVEVTNRWTRWGPVAPRSRRGNSLSLDGQLIVERYVFHQAEALNLRCFDLLLAKSTDEALGIAAESGGPVLNVVVGDRTGQVGWTLTGWLPRRLGRAGKEVVSWADGANGWDGSLRPDEHPRMSSPEVSRIFSANQRKLGTTAYLRLAPATGNRGERATQIRDALADLTNATPADMLAIQLDHRALSLGRWRELLLATLRHPQATEIFKDDTAEVVRFVADWDGLAAADSVAYRLVRAFAIVTATHLLEPVTTRAAKAFGGPTGLIWDAAERPVWALLDARPPHLLNPGFQSYDELLLRSAEEVVNQLKSVSGGELGRATWGRFANRPIRHPFSRMMPALSRWLDASTEGCAGGPGMPRVHSNGRGAVERLVVSPGHEREGLFHMPGGQSGHFLSPYYRAGHDAWVRGEPMPLLPGRARHTLRLAPQGR